MDQSKDTPTLSIRGLKTCFFTQGGVVPAVDGVDFDVLPGETLALVGESGCGKTAVALSVLRLIPSPPGKIVEGSILFQGEDLLQMSERDLRRIRGNRISMIFQEPATALNPVMRVGKQIAEVVRVHRRKSAEEARALAVETLRRVGVSAPEIRVDDYPHQLSGGMRQRVMIAMALACGPDLLLADEPTTAVDVTVQAQILELLKSNQEELGTALLLITHDLSLVAGTADRVAVMYASKIVEMGSQKAITERPRHPYTKGLFNSLPRMRVPQERLDEIPGVVPNPIEFPFACRFHPRCPKVQDLCRKEEPSLRELDEERKVACHFPC